MTPAIMGRVMSMGEDLAAASTEQFAATWGVVVVNYGTHALVEANLLRSLGPHFPGPVIVVDNYRDEAERAAVTSVCDRHGWTLLALPRNTGFGAGHNRGTAKARELGARVLLLLNPDAWLEPACVHSLMRQVLAEPSTLLAPQVLRPDGGLYSDENDVHLDDGSMLWRRLRPDAVSPERVHTWVSGACFAVSAELWRACGGFDEEYFLYWEDVDLARRVHAAGGSVRVEPTLVAHHDEGSSQREGHDEGLKSPTYFYFNARNRLLYAAKHVAQDDQVRWLRATPRAAYALAKQGGKRQFRHPSRNLWPVFRGSLDGVRYLRRARRLTSRADAPTA